MRKGFIYGSLVIALGLAVLSIWVQNALWAYLLIGPIVALGTYDLCQRRHTILRNFPLIGHFRYLFESISPEIQQYFIERHTDGTPISRNHRSLVYERAKEENPTHPYGTELNPYDPKYVGLRHSIYPAEPPSLDSLRVRIGGEFCRQPYRASLLNISAMSFGAISANAILAMGKGAKKGGFYQNTGEGGLSRYHLEAGGDIVWQIGTGYFGCRDTRGRFDGEAFREKATHEAVKMIEIKLSQGGKPGHGGVLPASKNNDEISKVRMVKAGTTIDSPQRHREFDDSGGLLEFCDRLRALSDGKPVGFKLCIGREEELRELCESMKRMGRRPDFMVIDGAEGGTGAAPLEYSDSVGMPMEPALRIADRTLEEYGLRRDIRLIASGKILTAFHVVSALAHGADLCNSARAFMLAVGCIQALRCNTNRCPTGITTMDPGLTKGLVVEDKYKRVANYHKNTLVSVSTLMAACGVRSPDELSEEIFLRGAGWKYQGGSEVG